MRECWDVLLLEPMKRALLGLRFSITQLLFMCEVLSHEGDIIMIMRCLVVFSRIVHFSNPMDLVLLT